jgi:hypothetical protein
MDSSMIKTEETLDRILAMRHQEDAGYVTRDWLQLEQQSECRYTHGPLHLAVDSECRKKMAAWKIQVVDSCKLNRETVEIAMSLLDRFMVTTEGALARRDRSVYQLASMTALYSAVKIHERSAMSPSMVSLLSHGVFSCHAIEKMEADILHALKWRVNPPTSFAYVRELLNLIPEQILSKEMRKTALHMSQLQTGLALADHPFMATRASTVAYSALMNSLESLDLGREVLVHVGYTLSQALQIDCDSDHVSTLHQFIVEPPPTTPASRGEGKENTTLNSTSKGMSAEVSPSAVSCSLYAMISIRDFLYAIISKRSNFNVFVEDIALKTSEVNK